MLRNDYWDSLRAGLLAGERLHQDIKRLDIAFLDQNLTIRYTARDAGDKLRRVATAAVPQFGEPPNAARPTLPVLLTARADFPSAWASPGPMVLTIGREFLPYWMDAAHLEIKDELTYVDVVKGQSGLPRSSNPVTRAGDVWTLPAKRSDAVDRVLLLAVAAP